MTHDVLILCVIFGSMIAIVFIVSLFKTIRLIFGRRQSAHSCPRCNEQAPHGKQEAKVSPDEYANRMFRLQKRIENLEEILTHSK